MWNAGVHTRVVVAAEPAVADPQGQTPAQRDPTSDIDDDPGGDVVRGVEIPLLDERGERDVVGEAGGGGLRAGMS